MAGTPDRTFHGIGVSAGTAVGPLVVVTPPPAAPVDEPPAADTAAAFEQVKSVLEQVAAGLEAKAQVASDHAKPILRGRRPDGARSGSGDGHRRPAQRW